MLYEYKSNDCIFPKKPFRWYLKRKHGLCGATFAFWIVKVVNKVCINNILVNSKNAFCFCFFFLIKLCVSE